MLSRSSAAVNERFREEEEDDDGVDVAADVVVADTVGSRVGTVCEGREWY